MGTIRSGKCPFGAPLAPLGAVLLVLALRAAGTEQEQEAHLEGVQFIGKCRVRQAKHLSKSDCRNWSHY